MKCNRVRIFLFAACTMLAFGCGDSGNSGNAKEQPGKTNEQPGDIVSVQNRTVSGVSQKGPFVTGSTVTVQELNGESLLQTGISFKGKISNDKGEFKVASINLASQYAFLEVNGYYRNEVTGQDSASPIIMNALADISDRENVNINLLTHLETDRVMHLVTVDGKSFAEAKEQARKELLGYFGIDGNFGAAEDMSIFGQSDDSAALLAISIIVQGDLRESQFTERLARIAGDIADGTIDKETVAWIRDRFHQMASHPLVAQAFAPTAKVKTECEVLYQGQVKRLDRYAELPDAIYLLDYKTGQHNDKHNEQVRLYAEALREMTDKEIRSFLVYLNETGVEVEPVSDRR